MKRWKMSLALCAAAVSMAIGAETIPVVEPIVRPAETGEVTKHWLAVQRQGSQSSAKPQPVSGRVQEKIYERYQKSFGQPIPERFESERATSR